MIQAPDGETELWPGMGKTGILVVDDDRAVCDVIRRTLKKEIDNADIKVVYDGISAVDALSRSLDIILLDLGLPNLRGEGVSLANELKNTNAPILVVTGEPNPDLKYMGDVNVMGVLKKPFELSELVRAVKLVLDGGEYPGK
ncbi:response regulator transcription factor [bacterium]|nr:response regulator transcription factor [bacterium]